MPPAMAASHRLAPVEARYAPLFCFILLAVACALASFAFACAAPFAAFAVVAAATLPLQSALLVMAATWLVNQAIGFGFLHYPIDASTIMWGFVIGAAALAATAASMALLRLMQHTGTAVALGAAMRHMSLCFSQRRRCWRVQKISRRPSSAVSVFLAWCGQ